MKLLMKTLLLPAVFVILAVIQVSAVSILGARSVYFLMRRKHDKFELSYDLLNNIMYLSCRVTAWWLLGGDIFGDNTED